MGSNCSPVENSTRNLFFLGKIISCQNSTGELIVPFYWREFKNSKIQILYFVLRSHEWEGDEEGCGAEEGERVEQAELVALRDEVDLVRDDAYRIINSGCRLFISHSLSPLWRITVRVDLIFLVIEKEAIIVINYISRQIIAFWNMPYYWLDEVKSNFFANYDCLFYRTVQLLSTPLFYSLWCLILTTNEFNRELDHGRNRCSQSRVSHRKAENWKMWSKRYYMATTNK